MTIKDDPSRIHATVSILFNSWSEDKAGSTILLVVSSKAEMVASGAHANSRSPRRYLASGIIALVVLVVLVELPMLTLSVLFRD